MIETIFLSIWIAVSGGNIQDRAIPLSDLSRLRAAASYAIANARNISNVSDMSEPILLSNGLPNVNRDNRDNIDKILILAGLVSTTSLIGWQLRQRSSVKYSNYDLGKTSKKALIDRVNPKLRRQLLRLINDPKTANRLLVGIYEQNRDRDPDWIAEKVIYDLRRGR